jgi:hypothetical protein
VAQRLDVLSVEEQREVLAALQTQLVLEHDRRLRIVVVLPAPYAGRHSGADAGLGLGLTPLMIRRTFAMLAIHEGGATLHEMQGARAYHH